MIVTLDFDDFSPMNHRFDLLSSLLERYPGMKVTMFTVPWEIRLNPDGKGTPITDKKYENWVNAVKRGISEGWLEIAIHGLTHNPLEFEKLSYQEAKNRMIVAMKMFKNVGIDYVPLFKAPNWAMSKEAKKAAEDLELKVMEDGYYNWNIKEEMPKFDIVIAHGHVQDEEATMNGMEQSFMNITQIPAEAEWKFLSEVV